MARLVVRGCEVHIAKTYKAKISKMDFFVVPRTTGTALIFVIPRVGVKASQTGNQHAAEALYIPSDKSLRVPAAGWAQFPMTEYIGPDPMVFPDSEELREFPLVLMGVLALAQARPSWNT